MRPDVVLIQAFEGNGHTLTFADGIYSWPTDNGTAKANSTEAWEWLKRYHPGDYKPLPPREIINTQVEQDRGELMADDKATTDVYSMHDVPGVGIMTCPTAVQAPPHWGKPVDEFQSDSVARTFGYVEGYRVRDNRAKETINRLRAQLAEAHDDIMTRAAFVDELQAVPDMQPDVDTDKLQADLAMALERNTELIEDLRDCQAKLMRSLAGSQEVPDGQ